VSKRSVTKYVPLRRVLGGKPLELHASIARLSVLYEDLYLELTEAAPPDVKQARRSYFIRRSFATLREFGECLVRLDGGADFRRVLWRQFDGTERGQWNAAIAWFGEHAQQIQNVRNDFGGHFSYDAALYAVQHLDEVGDASLEMRRDGETAGPHLHFADALVQITFLRRKAELDEEAYATALFMLARTGYQQAVRCVHLVLAYYLAPRFGFLVKPPSERTS